MTRLTLGTVNGYRLLWSSISGVISPECLFQVVECHLVTDPRTRESRGFAFVTMETVEGAERCIKYLNRSVLEGRLITVEKVLIYTKDLIVSL